MVIRRMVSSVVQRQVKYVAPVPQAAARGLVAKVYEQVQAEMRIVVPPALLHSPAPELLAAYWMLVREPLMPTGTVSRAVKETVATAVSMANTCPYCADMHSVGMYDLATESDAEALTADRLDDLSAPLRQIATWARASHEPEHDLVLRPPFPAAQRPELVGVVVGIHYLARIVNVFLSSFLLPPGLSPSARRRFKRGASHVLRPALRDHHEPGRALLLPAAGQLPLDASWATGAADIEQAVTRSYAAFEQAGAEALSPAVRELVQERLAAWRGEEMGLSRSWCERLVTDLPDADQSAARLALLTVFASYQVDEQVIQAFRVSYPDDRTLVQTVAWASYAAARHIGGWHNVRRRSQQSGSHVAPAQTASSLP